MLKKTLAGCAIVLVSVIGATAASAQEIATVVLRDGQRLSGELNELDASGFTLRINGEDRGIRVNDVAIIEYVGGTPSDQARMTLTAGQPVVVLRNGEVIQGRLVDIGGVRPKRLTIETPSGQRDLMSTDVAQIYMHPPTALALPPGATVQGVAPAAPAAPAAGAIAIPGNQPWTPTRVQVKKGERITFIGTGDILVAATASSGIGGSPAATNPTSKYPAALPVGALIGRVNTGAPFAVGGDQPKVMPATGFLFLGINDDHFEDNSGNYYVLINK